MYGWSEAEAAADERARPDPTGAGARKRWHAIRIARAEILEPYPNPTAYQQGLFLAVSIISTALLNDAGEMYAIAHGTNDR